MKLRVDHREANPGAYQALVKVETFVQTSGLEKSLLELVKIRASQINGCAFCLDMHVSDSRKLGETEQRLQLVAVWRESPPFTERERAALELTETLTRVADRGVPSEVYELARQHFDEKEYVSLVMAIIAINSWNRIAIATGMFPGCFEL